jgi:exosome complex component RRP42
MKKEEKNKMDKVQTTSDITAERIVKYMEEGKRFDGRGLDEFREIEVETGVSKNAEGSARVKIGKTEVIVGVKMDVATPYPDSPDKGNMMVTAELLPLSSPRFEYGPPKFPAIELGRVIDRGIRESHFIDLEKLCIKEGEKVWTVFIDIYTINDDGNLFDAAGLGAIIALKNARVPKYDEENERVLYGELTDENVPLSKTTPISITTHKIDGKFIVDPTREEEDISETRITIGSTDGVISSMQKGEKSALTIEEFSEALDLVNKVYKEIFKKLEKHLK